MKRATTAGDLPIRQIIRPNPQNEAEKVSSRLFFLDAVRALMMLLGIPFHAAALYGSGGEIFGTRSDSRTADVIFDSIHSFRMQAFFIIAGYFAMKSIVKTEPQLWMRKRMERLGLPLISGLVLIGPVVVLLNSVNVLSSLGDTWAVCLRNAWSGFTLSILFGHLWFLRDLLLMSFVFFCLHSLLAACLRVPVLANLIAWIRARPSVDFAGINVLLVAYECAVTLVNHHHPFGTWFFGAIDVRDFFRLAGFFVYGAIMEASVAGFSWFCRFQWRSLVMSALSIAVYHLFCDLDTPFAKTVTMAGWCISGIWTSQAVISICCSKFSKDTPFIRKLTDASVTMYIVHYPIVGFLGCLLFFVDAAASLKILLIVVGTTAMSYAIHRIVRRSSLALLLLNGIRPRPPNTLRTVQA